MKTLHHHKYWSAMADEQNQAVIRNRNDNYWSRTPVETIHFMKQVKKPWIAYKVLAAGAIKPNDGIDYAFKNGADFACVGMFDFQVTQDATIARNAVKEHKNRRRPWRA
jgi:NAD(P)H-dependent flavin oxidoreductase YrpB (nitropropane dioxygenase family)